MIHPLFDIDGKKAIVTGGTKGLGYGMAEALAEAGCHVVIIGSSQQVFKAAESLCARGLCCSAVQADLRSEEENYRAFRESLALLGGELDIMVTAAGIQRRHLAEDFPMQEWNEVLNLNLRSVWIMCQEAGRVMLPNGYGKIINVASMNSFFGGQTVPAYSAAKGAVMQLTKALSNELASKGICVNAIAPGYMEPALTADMIRTLCATHADEMMVSPKLVYISNTTEIGTVYTRAELQALRAVCDELGLLLYCDGARLACAMAVSDTTYADYAATCDAFTIGGTKNGLLFGEALIITNPALTPGFRSCMKQQGATLAKGRLLGVQFAAILKDDLYMDLARQSSRMAEKLTAGLKALDIPFMIDSPSNQIFPILPSAVVEALRSKVAFEFWSHADETHDAIRFVTAWHTTEEEIDALLQLLKELLSA